MPRAREPRGPWITGESHYNVLSAARFGVADILSSSTLPLRMLAYLGFVALPLDFVFAVIVLVVGDQWGMDLPARVLTAFAAFHLGWILAAVGFLAIYLARVYKDVIGLPLYVVDQRLSAMSKHEA